MHVQQRVHERRLLRHCSDLQQHVHERCVIDVCCIVAAILLIVLAIPI